MADGRVAAREAGCDPELCAWETPQKNFLLQHSLDL